MATRSGGLLTTAVVVGAALVVALLSSFVWPSAPSSETEPVAGVVDATGPVGRVGVVVTGPNTGGATEPSVELPGGAPGDYTERAGTGGITGPIGGLEAVRGGLATPRAAVGGAVSGARDTAANARSTVAAVRATPTTARR